jgi:hypothetical protein
MTEREKFEAWVNTKLPRSLVKEFHWEVWQACAEQYEVRLKKLENALDNTVRQRDGWKEHVEELKLDIKELKNKLIEYEG